jgi:hypothetical protein
MSEKPVKINLQAILPKILREKIEEHLSNDNVEDKNIYLYNGPTHGCIMRGIPVTFSLGPNAVFYEAPKEAIIL